ncbi:MAG: dipeptidase [Anaerovoracaceae bacterium]|jgi:membrane dipeptidase
MIFDGHSDLWEDVYEKRLRGMTSIIPRFHMKKWKEGNVNGGFYPIWADPYRTVYPIPVKQQAHAIITSMQQEIKEDEQFVQVVRNLHEYQNALRLGKHALFLGSEGLSYIGSEIEKLEKLYALGFREASLTWNEENELATGPDGDPERGLTESGIRCIKKIHALDMILDLAHANEKTFWDAVKLTDRPFIISHSGCRSVCDVPRNLTDDQIRAVAERQGVIGIYAYAPFLSEEPQHRNLQGFADHIDHVASLVGVDYVGLGFDFVDFLDDVGTDPTISEVTTSLECIEKSGGVVQELKARGYSESEICKICKGNFLRVIQSVLK